MTRKRLDEKLTADDAEYVDALHTDMFGYGAKYSLADRDISINNGQKQPMCKGFIFSIGLLASICGHFTAPNLVSTYMGKCMMVAYFCESFDKFEGELMAKASYLIQFQLSLRLIR